VSTPVFEMEDVSASYSTYRALFGVSLTIPSDGIVALLGSNGAGKSTLARVATGLVPVSSGTIRVSGQDVTRYPAHRIARMGVTHVPEGRAVFSSLTVEENLTVSFLKRVGRGGIGAALERAYQAFPVLAERRRQLGGTLSGGQQRILSLAKVLAVAPKLLVVDELSLGLAPVVVDQVYDGLVAIHQQGCALLVVEQQVDRALAIADHAVLLVKGAVAWEGPARDAKPVLEAQMLSGVSSNGAAPSANGAGPVPSVVAPLAVAAAPAPPPVSAPPPPHPGMPAAVPPATPRSAPVAPPPRAPGTAPVGAPMPGAPVPPPPPAPPAFGVGAAPPVQAVPPRAPVPTQGAPGAPAPGVSNGAPGSHLQNGQHPPEPDTHPADLWVVWPTRPGAP